MGSALRIAALCMLAVPAVAGGVFNVSADIRSAHQLIYSLKFAEAEHVLAEIRRSEPDNLLVYYLEDLIDFLTIFIDGDASLYQDLKGMRELRIKLISLGDTNSPYYLFLQAEIYLHWAILRLKFGENFSAIADINRAFRLLKRNERRHPHFSANLKSLGILRTAVGTVPDQYRWAIELLSSMEGDIDGGLRDMRQAMRYPDDFVIAETRYLYALALLHFGNDPDAALEFVRTGPFAPRHNALDCFLMSHIAMKAGRNDLAIRLLENKPQHPGVHPVPVLDLLYGTARLHRLDKDADEPLHRFLTNYRGSDYRKEALQKLAWHALIHGNRAQYHHFIMQCLLTGADNLESDRYALQEARSNVIPHREILKARLLFDGGYYERALEILSAVDNASLTEAEALEYSYRTARVFQALDRPYDALFQFKVTLTRGQNSPLHFACAAALQTGLIYEAMEDHENAEYYLKICLTMKPDNYQAGLHQKAKAGLGRLKK